jgi:hypothetical protein
VNYQALTSVRTIAGRSTSWLLRRSALVGLDGLRAAARRVVLVLSQIRSAYDALMSSDPGPLVALMADDVEWRGVPHGVLRRAPA